MDTTLYALAKLLADDGILAHEANLTQDQAELVVTGADCDSRFSAPHHIFVCKGASFKAAYLQSAVEAGAVAYLCDEGRAAELAAAAPDVPALVASDLRRAMALVSAEAWGHPDRDLQMIGLTGTKGKSTTAYMLRAIMDAGVPEGSRATGIIGSIETYDGIEDAESVNTTPEAPDLWRHLANTKTSGLGRMVMEVSSQALKYDRVVGLSLDVAVFLNIGRDHISPNEHSSFEDYFKSKLRIFDHARVAAVNLDTGHLDEVMASAAACKKIVTFSATNSDADVWCKDVEPFQGGITFVAHTPSWEQEVTLSMPGLFNVDNALAAIAVCEVLGIDATQVAAGLARVRVPGRMELILTEDPKVTAIVDYAHNKLSYQRFFSSVSKEFAGRDIIAVLGAPGGKAFERRTELPQEASKWADHLIYTEEDPAHDSVEDICAQMAAATPEGQAFDVIVDRPEAIERAVDLAFASERGALVCLLAKGEETRQHRGDRFEPCETDATIFERAVAARLAAI